MQRSELAHLRRVYTSEHACYTAPCAEKTNWDTIMSNVYMHKLGSGICIENHGFKFTQ